MAIYAKLLNASDLLAEAVKNADNDAEPYWDSRNQSTILKRIALGTALEHAYPISHK
jgi:hypothetical protein